MSLTPVVGLYEMLSEDEEGREHFLDDLEQINRRLVENGLRRHEEPQSLPEYTLRVEMNHLGTSWIHHLRRLQARALQSPGSKHVPVRDADKPWLDEAVDRELTVYLRSHLILHADTEGYYVPIDFADVLYGAPGGDMLGSSQRLLAPFSLFRRTFRRAVKGGSHVSKPTSRVSATAPSASRAVPQTREGLGQGLSLSRHPCRRRVRRPLDLVA